jgi:hypothetical protein
MGAALMQLQQHGWGNHAVRLRHEVVPQGRKGFLRPYGTSRRHALSSGGMVAASAPQQRRQNGITSHGSDGWNNST